MNTTIQLEPINRKNRKQFFKWGDRKEIGNYSFEPSIFGDVLLLFFNHMHIGSLQYIGGNVWLTLNGKEPERIDGFEYNEEWITRIATKIELERDR